MSDEVLSQSEVESLLQAMESVEVSTTKSLAPTADSDPARPKLREKVTPYDFKRPERVGKEQMRALQTLHEGFSRNFAASLSGLMRSMVDVRLSSVDQLTYSEFVFSLENPTCFNVLRAEPLEGNLILDINPSVLFPILDRLLGGGKESSPPVRRPLTEIELRLVSRMTQLFLTELQKAWENVVRLSLAVEKVESNPQLVSIVPPNEVIILLSFELTMGQNRGMMNLCIPYNSIERISGRLTANTWQTYGKRASTEVARKQMSRRLEQSLIEMSVTLAESSITTSELLGLKVGDIITTDHDIGQPMSVMIGEQKKYEAHPGSLKGRKAIQIADIFAPVEPIVDSRDG